jgi:hypothetical protein
VELAACCLYWAMQAELQKVSFLNRGKGSSPLRAGTHAVPEFIDPRFRENKTKPPVFSHWKRAFWACFRKNCVYNFGHRSTATWLLYCVSLLSRNYLSTYCFFFPCPFIFPAFQLR